MRKEDSYQFGKILAVSPSLLVYVDTWCVVCVVCGGVVNGLNAVAAAPGPFSKIINVPRRSPGQRCFVLTLTLPSLEEKPTSTRYTCTRVIYTHAVQDRHSPLAHRALPSQAAVRPNFCSTKIVVPSFSPPLQAL